MHVGSSRILFVHYRATLTNPDQQKALAGCRVPVTESVIFSFFQRLNYNTQNALLAAPITHVIYNQKFTTSASYTARYVCHFHVLHYHIVMCRNITGAILQRRYTFIINIRKLQIICVQTLRCSAHCPHSE